MRLPKVLFFLMPIVAFVLVSCAPPGEDPMEKFCHCCNEWDGAWCGDEGMCKFPKDDPNVGALCEGQGGVLKCECVELDPVGSPIVHWCGQMGFHKPKATINCITLSVGGPLNCPAGGGGGGNA